jgi:hypothetical protein
MGKNTMKECGILEVLKRIARLPSEHSREKISTLELYRELDELKRQLDEKVLHCPYAKLQQGGY